MQIMTKRTFNTISILCEDDDHDADDVHGLCSSSAAIIL